MSQPFGILNLIEAYVSAVIEAKTGTDPTSAERVELVYQQILTQTRGAVDLLEEFAGQSMDLTNAMCHRGLVSASLCSRCSRDIRAWKLIAKLKGEIYEDPLIY